MVDGLSKFNVQFGSIKIILNNSSYGMKWTMKGGIIPATKYPYLDGEGRCKDRKREAVGFVDTPIAHDFKNGNAEYIK